VKNLWKIYKLAYGFCFFVTSIPCRSFLCMVFAAHTGVIMACKSFSVRLPFTASAVNDVCTKACSPLVGNSCESATNTLLYVHVHARSYIASKFLQFIFSAFRVTFLRSFENKISNVSRYYLFKTAIRCE
jgi:hypothetical protein